jgi:hypothetical protein
MTNDRPFIRINGDYVRLDAISCIKKNIDGFVVHLKSGDHTLIVKGPSVKDFESFFNDHTVLSVISDPLTGGQHSVPLR